MRVQAISTLIMLNFLLNPEKKISYIYLPIYFYKNKWGIGGYFYKKIIFYFFSLIDFAILRIIFDELGN